jgi:hypothetical protein
MNTTPRSLIAATCVAVSSLTWAAAADEHAGHHPDAASAASAPAGKAKAAKPAATPRTQAPAKATAPAPVDQQMQAMQAMHDKMMSARTPEERRGLLDEQMKTMESGMAMMEQMGMGAQAPAPAASAGSGMGMGGGMGMGAGGMHAQHELMMKRMEMMQMMMRMMMDRLSVEPAK